MGLLSRGASFLATARAVENNFTCTYVRKSTGAEVSISAGIGTTEVDLDTYDRATVIRRPVDFLVQATELRTDADDASTQFQPEKGDVIRSSHTGTACEYLVTPEAGEDCFVPHTPRCETWRIHTKKRS